MTVETSSVPKIAELGHVGVRCFDLARQLEFYTEVLGLAVTDHDEGLGVFSMELRGVGDAVIRGGVCSGAMNGEPAEGHDIPWLHEDWNRTGRGVPADFAMAVAVAGILRFPIAFQV